MLAGQKTDKFLISHPQFETLNKPMELVDKLMLAAALMGMERKIQSNDCWNIYLEGCTQNYELSI